MGHSLHARVSDIGAMTRATPYQAAQEMFPRETPLIQVTQPTSPQTAIRPENPFSPERLAQAGFIFHPSPQAVGRAAFATPETPTRAAGIPLPPSEAGDPPVQPPEGREDEECKGL